jgi:hypothetical protein
MYGIGPSHMLKMAMLKQQSKWTCILKIERYGMGSNKVNSSGLNPFLFKLYFIGMSYY